MRFKTTGANATAQALKGLPETKVLRGGGVTHHRGNPTGEATGRRTFAANQESLNPTLNRPPTKGDQTANANANAAEADSQKQNLATASVAFSLGENDQDGDPIAMSGQQAGFIPAYPNFSEI